MKINKIDVLAKNTKHVGLLLLLLVFVKLFLFLTSFLENVALASKKVANYLLGPPEDWKLALGPKPSRPPQEA